MRAVRVHGGRVAVDDVPTVDGSGVRVRVRSAGICGSDLHLIEAGVVEAAQVTLGGFFLLTGVVVVTRKDFSFLRTFLVWGGIFALGAIACAVLFNFDLGTWFSVAMVLLAGGSILHTTSAVMRDYPEDADLAAAIQLFAGVALMFWYVLRLFLSARR
jgi:FtsH-binding integral membrane protein